MSSQLKYNNDITTLPQLIDFIKNCKKKKKKKYKFSEMLCLMQRHIICTILHTFQNRNLEVG